MLWTVVDLVYTTFAPRGSGYISGSVTSGLWYFFKFLDKRLPYKSILDAAGISIIMSILLVWTLLLWTGNVLMFASTPMAVVNSTSKLPATTLERVYYAGYLLSTLGNGNFEGGTDWWMIISSIMSFTGLMMITIAISYMVPVLSAITSRRAISIRIASIGHSPQAMLLNNWNGKNFSMLNDQLQELALSIAGQGQLHLAYPVLHYFHHSQKSTAILPNLAALDEALSILLLYVPEDQQPDKQYLEPVRKSITTFLESLTTTFINPSGGDIPPFNISELKRAHIPLLEPEEEKIRQLDFRRHILEAMLKNDGWNWEKLDNPVFNEKMDLHRLNANQ
ncbi:hypothetical protein [Pontibacter chitinilyticus]|uniref:hypothetical protein n=1 Tax=Pontibacter chitinilyticus TaxID=2674989 RepID=UPI00321A86B5